MTEEDKAVIGDFFKVAHKVGMSKAAVLAAIQFVEAHGKQAAEAVEKQRRDRFNDAEIALRREWKGEFDVNHAIAKDAVKQYGDEEFRALAEMPGHALAQLLGDKSLNEHPSFAKVWANIGRRTGTAQPIINSSPVGMKTEADLREMYMSDRYQKQQDPEFVRYVDEGFKRLYGTAA